MIVTINIKEKACRTKKEFRQKMRGTWHGVKPVSIRFADKTKWSKAARSQQKAMLHRYL